jgi:uncharacterized Zn ribbon protein
MKKCFFLLLVCLGCVAVNAQKKTTTNKTSKDCVMMKDGQMMTIKHGDTTMLDSSMKMKNGTMVMSDGTVKMKNGKTMQLKNGDCVMMDGTVKHASTTKSKTKKEGY